MRDRILLYALAVSVGVHLLVLSVVGRTSSAHSDPFEPEKAFQVSVVRTVDDAIESPKPEMPRVKPVTPPAPPRVQPIPKTPPIRIPFLGRFLQSKPQAQPQRTTYKPAGNPGGALNTGSGSSRGQNLVASGRTPVGWVPGADNGRGAGSGSGEGVGRPEPVRGAVDGPGREASPPPPPPSDVDVRVCAESGMLPGPNCQSIVTRAFHPGREPEQTCSQCRPPHQSTLADRSTPELISGQRRPKYPSQARDEGIQGAVTLEYTVDTEGGVVAVKVASSSGHGDLDEAAVDAVKSRKYKPAVQAGIPRNYRKRETFRFSLD